MIDAAPLETIVVEDEEAIDLISAVPYILFLGVTRYQNSLLRK